MKRDLLTSLIAVVVLTIVLGIAYPLAITGISQVVFPGKANGSKLTLNGRTVGSSLIGQDFKGVPAYFQSRPSATEYSADATFFANVGPNSVEGREEVRENLAAYLKLNRPYDKSLSKDQVPVDAVTNSASGVDPQISEANAQIQAHRVAAVRGLSLARVEDLITSHTDGRSLGVFGEPGVNVLELNIALEEFAADGPQSRYIGDFEAHRRAERGRDEG
jgi:potassium-transporting ATPase KdpC subunit